MASRPSMPGSMPSSTKIRIAARLRPRIQGELGEDAVDIQREEDGTSFVAMGHPRDPLQQFKFRFHSCYGPDSTQEEIFSNDVRPMVDLVYSGVAVTVFAYGVTSSGKTHTMQGTKAQPGIIGQVVESLFQLTDNYRHVNPTLSVSYMEIYKDDVYDLLVERDMTRKLPVRENDVGKVFVANLSSSRVDSPEAFYQIYNNATKRRSVGATNLNRASSRSHAILTIQVTLVDAAAQQTLTGKINLVDLAGSENNKLTGNDPSRMAESAAINKSLSVLGQVVHALNQGASRIPYRDSKLTRILQDALGGTAVGLLICNLAPGAKFRQDTWNTLNFASRTKEIENKPTVNIRDNRPQPKAHFAAIASAPPFGVHAILPATLSAPVQPTRKPAARASLNPSAGPSKLPAPSRGRYSALPFGATTFQSFAMPLPTAQSISSHGNQGNSGTTMTQEEIDERIAKAVEQEVAKRLEERERQRLEEESRRSESQGPSTSTAVESTNAVPPNLPSGVLTPILKRHRDDEAALEKRLMQLEEKYERSNKETQLADVLSPTSRKRTGKAYVSLAREHSQKGDLHVALDLYRKAETYVPENVKLKERIIEIEWAVNNNLPYVPEPRKPKTKKKKPGREVASNGDDSETLQEQVEAGDGESSANEAPVDSRDTDADSKPNFPLSEKTNSPGKRRADNGLDAETPQKKRKQVSPADGMDVPALPLSDIPGAPAPVRTGTKVI